MSARTVYDCVKLGTVPYAGVITRRPLVAGDRVWVPDTDSFKRVEARVSQPRHCQEFIPCVVDKVDGDVLFLAKM